MRSFLKVHGKYTLKIIYGFQNFLHPNKLMLTCCDMSERDLVWDTKKDKTSIWKEPMFEQHEF